MKIDIRSENSLYIELNGWTYYIDDSTNEQIIEKFNDDTPREIQCPHCDETLTVYHMDWSAIVCLHCKEEINIEDVSIHLEWNINCDNDAKNDYKDEHEVRCEHFKLNNGKYKAVYECESCDYKHTEITNHLNIIG